MSIDPSYCIVGGDFNVDVRRPGVCQESIKKFMSAYNFSCSINSNLSDNMYTFKSKSTRCTSVIDYFLCSCSLGELVECIVFDEGDNLSDHNPVKVVLNIPVVYVNKMSSDNCNTQSKTLWDKASPNNISLYQANLGKLLSDISIPWEVIKSQHYQDKSSNVKIQQFYEDIVNSCLSAGFLSIPQKGISSKWKNVPGWKEYVEPYRKRSLMWHNIWKENGRPQSGYLQFIRNKTRTEYHYCLRYVKKNSDSILTEKLGDYMANKKVHSFWAEIKKIKGKNNNLPLSVDGVSGESNIANLFSEKYKKLFSSVSYDKVQMSHIKEKHRKVCFVTVYMVAVITNTV